MIFKTHEFNLDLNYHKDLINRSIFNLPNVPGFFAAAKSTTMNKIFTFLMATAMGGSALAQNPFPPLQKNFYDSTAYGSDLTEVMVPASPMKYDVLFVGGTDMVYNNSGQSAPAKEWQDFTGYVPIDGRSDSGYVIVNHERVQSDPVNGDGGGMTVFIAHKDATGHWNVVDQGAGVKFKNVDFSNVGGTGANCGGIQSSWGAVFTAEEWGSAFNGYWLKDQNGVDSFYVTGNARIASQGFSDTTDWNVASFNGAALNQSIKRNQNFQYIVEVDPATAQAVRKNYNMGRYDHEGGWIAGDHKTVYLSDDASSGSVLFKFVADQPKDFSKGSLFAYKQSTDGSSGSWLTMPMSLDSMVVARDVALHMGATIFMRLEWVEGQGNNVYITETGRGKTFNVSGAISKGGVLAKHLRDLDTDNDGKAEDIFGRVLRLDAQSNKIEIMLEGGGTLDGNNLPTGNHLTSPDGLALGNINGKTYLVINEDLNPNSSPASPAQFSKKLNEIYFLDITGDVAGKTYQVSELIRFVAGPKGCETTGGRFTPDGLTYFFNVQHPDPANTYPFNHSVTVAVTGFEDYLTSVQNTDSKGLGLNIWPNPVARELHLNKVTDVRLIEIATGKVVRVQRNTNRMDVSGLPIGNYVIQTIEGEVQKVIIQ